jgi:hypothetical protein
MNKDEFISMIARLAASDEPDAPFSEPGEDAIGTIDSLIGFARRIQAEDGQRKVAMASGIAHTSGTIGTVAAEPDFSDPDDRAVTAGAKFLPGNLDAGLVPGIELGGVQVTAWRQDGALQVDVNLEDAEPGETWKLDGNQLTVTATVAGLTADRGQHELDNACYRCGNDNENGCGDGYMGLCANCADQDYAESSDQ